MTKNPDQLDKPKGQNKKSTNAIEERFSSISHNK